MKIYIDEAWPESCASCQFLVRCCECEGYENLCPFIGEVGYDPSDDLKEGAPITPTGERHEECPLVQMSHGAWEHLKEHITEMRDADGELNQKDTCKFILELMGVIEREGEASDKAPDNW